jgi:glycosyltransferase involved in cell wall biosynthesis
MKKVLVFSLTYYPNQTSGAEAAIKEITDRLPDIEFHLVTLRYNSALPKVEKIGNVLVHRIGITAKDPTYQDLGKLPLDLNKPLFQFLAPLKALSLHRKYRYDAIWSMMAHSTGVPAAIFKMFQPKVGYVLTLQEGDPAEYIEKVMKPLWPLFTRAFAKADVVQAISTYLADWAKRRGVPEERIELIANGANPRDLADSVPEAELDELRQQLGKTPDKIFLVNTARLVHQKANDDTIRALALLPQNVYLLLVGDGQDEQMLRDLAKELKVDSRVIFTGNVDRSQVTKYRKISDIFVCPSRSEGLGNAFLSAMASRLPVVATQEGGLAEFISDETAWVVEKDSPQQIAGAVKSILANPNQVEQRTDFARRMVEEKYNWDAVAKAMNERVFGRVL